MAISIGEEGRTSDLDRWLGTLRRRWAALVQGATAVLGIVGTFVLPPPPSEFGETPWRRLAQFVAAVLIGLVFVAARRWPAGRRALWWWVALASLALGVVTTFGYDALTRGWSCQYDGRQVIVGAEYTAHAREHRRLEPSGSCERLIRDFAGQLDDVWVGGGIRWRHSVLAALYVGAVTLFTSCVLALVEAVAEVERRGRRARRRGGAGRH